jgi:glycosyltransferase involved in cell wall biosynthesis
LKKILLVTQYIFPCTLTPAQRMTYWAENFHRLGFYPIVVTRIWNSDIRTHHDTKLPLGERIKLEKHPTHEVHYLPFIPGILDQAYLKFGESVFRPLFLLIKLLDVFFVRFTLRFTSFSNYLPYLKKLTSEQNLEQMIISGEPFYLFRLGFSLQKFSGIKWIADYRDDWSTNELQMEKSGGVVRKWIANIESAYERKWVGTAYSVISVSAPYTKRISEFLNKPGITIQNGFEESLLDLPQLELYGQFTVMYSGVLYPSQDIRVILDVLDLCHKAGTPFRLVFLGAGFDIKEKRRIESMVPDQLRSFVEVTDRYPRQEALYMLQKAHVLLGIAYGSMKGIPSSKLYEYLALGKPVLLCPTDEDLMEEILKESGLGFFVKNAVQGKSLILDLMHLYDKEESLSVLRQTSRKSVTKYSRFYQLRKLADDLGK